MWAGAMYKENDLLLSLRPHTHYECLCLANSKGYKYQLQAKICFLDLGPKHFSHTAGKNSHWQQVDMLLKNPYIDLARNL